MPLPGAPGSPVEGGVVGDVPPPDEDPPPPVDAPPPVEAPPPVDGAAGALGAAAPPCEFSSALAADFF